MSFSKSFHHLVTQINSVSALDCPVLLLGEIGTGKRHVAVTIHKLSRRSKGRFVNLNCVGVSSGQFLLDMFGYQSDLGELTRKGALFLAEQGTLYLHEIGELPLDSQAQLVRFLEDRSYRPQNSNGQVETDVRIVCSSSASLEALVEAGKFRADLYYLLGVAVIRTPSLADRLEDLPKLATQFLAEMGISKTLSAEAIEVLMHHSFSGNLYELKNILYRAALSPARVIGESEILQSLAAQGSVGFVNDVESIRSSTSSAVAHGIMEAIGGPQNRIGTAHPSDSTALVDNPAGKAPVSVAFNGSGRWGKAAVSSEDIPMEVVNALDQLPAYNRAPDPDAGLPESSVEPKASTKPDPGKRAFNLKQQERAYLLELLDQHAGDKVKVAKIAGINLRTLYRKLR